MTARRLLGAALATTLAALATPLATAATASLSASADTYYANMPFTLTLKAEGFAEEPPPAPPPLAIAGCEVTYLGMSPSVSSHIQIINGRRSEWKQVTFNYQWRVVAAATGRYSVPALRLSQNGVEAGTPAAAFEVAALPATSDMIVRMELPARDLWAGETFDVAVTWLLNREVESHEFSVPLFSIDGAEVTSPRAGGAQAMRFAAGAGEVALPLERSQVREDGRAYTRFRFPARVTLHRPGAVEVAPVRVLARLQTGTTRDSWGFRRARHELFSAQGQRRRLTVRPLPEAGRPANFVNAIGTGFAIDVQASRTVVAVGDPIELTVRLHSDGPLTGVGLPRLDGPGTLPPALFGITEASPAGEIDEATGSKRFAVTVRIKSAEVREVPPLSFAYFDPVAGAYRSVASQPIALSVGAGQLVGAGEVVAAPRPDAALPTPARTDGAGTGGRAGGLTTLLGADMALSDSAQTLATPWQPSGAVLLALYLVPCGAFACALLLRRSTGRRQHGRELRQAASALQRALGSTAPAREAAPLVATAARRLARLAGVDPAAFGPLLERLETRAFDPTAAAEPLPADAVAELGQLARQWRRQAAKGVAASVALTMVLLVAPAVWAEAPAAAPQDDAAALAAARATYGEALAETDRLRRVRLFASAERALRSLAAANPNAPALQVDWGNAALGAQDAGRAVLAYRRALRQVPSEARAAANLAWLRNRQPSWLPRPASAGALDSLLFWRNRFTAAQLHLAGAAAFAGGVLLLAPWWPPRRRWPRKAAVPLLLAWALAAGTALSVKDDANAAVVLADGTALRAADSAGAALAFAQPLPAGTEVTVQEARGGWRRVALADGTRGWLAASAVALVASDAATPPGEPDSST